MSKSLVYSEKLIGLPGSRYRIPTPALIVDEVALDANIERMANRLRGKIDLRPHAKTHKSAWIAKKQIEAGAVGVCCTKLGEAESLIDAGIRGVLLTSPSVGEFMADRICKLAELDPDFSCVVDHPSPLANLSERAKELGVCVNVLIDVDVGLTRTGVRNTESAIELAKVIDASNRALRLTGVQGYGGHWQHIPGFDERRKCVKEGMATLTAIVEALRESKYAINIITGGGTGTIEADLELGVLTELQPGSYVFMDAQYNDALGQDVDGAFKNSLFVGAQVVSINAQHTITVDAGLKAFSTEGPAPRSTTEKYAQCTYVFFGDEHGALSRPSEKTVSLGDRMEFLTPHCDPTVDRYDVYHVVNGDRLTAVIPIEAARASN